jgi:GDP-4-dehydro-6-deoxy-D-mannose reductase
VRALITGASGFAGRWLTRACLAAGDEVIALTRRAEPATDAQSVATRRLAVDLRDAQGTAAAVEAAAPDVVYHLAAFSHVGRSWETPGDTLADNAVGAANLLEAIRRHAPQARVVWSSSCEVYGRSERLPVAEDAPLHPATPYAVSKATGEMLANLYAEAHGLSIVIARPFNHAGPGQQPIFIVSSLAHQAAEARRAGARSVRIVTGNPSTRRDFTDVRDVIRAYRLLARADLPPLALFNISTGASVSTTEHVALLADLVAPLEVEHHVDPARVRAHEVMDHRGSSERLTAATGWRPEIPLRQTMADTLEWWERELTQRPA